MVSEIFRDASSEHMRQPRSSMGRQSDQVRANALKHMVKTFFGGSPEQAVAALLEMSDSTLSSKDKQYLSQLIKKAQQEGR